MCLGFTFFENGLKIRFQRVCEKLNYIRFSRINPDSKDPPRQPGPPHLKSPSRSGRGGGCLGKFHWTGVLNPIIPPPRGSWCVFTIIFCQDFRPPKGFTEAQGLSKNMFFQKKTCFFKSGASFRRSSQMPHAATHLQKNMFFGLPPAFTSQKTCFFVP